MHKEDGSKNVDQGEEKMSPNRIIPIVFVICVALSSFFASATPLTAKLSAIEGVCDSKVIFEVCNGACTCQNWDCSRCRDGTCTCQGSGCGCTGTYEDVTADCDESKLALDSYLKYSVRVESGEAPKPVPCTSSKIPAAAPEPRCVRISWCDGRTEKGYRSIEDPILGIKSAGSDVCKKCCNKGDSECLVVHGGAGSSDTANNYVQDPATGKIGRCEVVKEGDGQRVTIWNDKNEMIANYAGTSGTASCGTCDDAAKTPVGKCDGNKRCVYEPGENVIENGKVVVKGAKPPEMKLDSDFCEGVKLVIQSVDGASFILTSNVEGAVISQNPSILDPLKPREALGTTKGGCDQGVVISKLEKPPPGIGYLRSEPNPLKAEKDGMKCEFTVNIDKDGFLTSAFQDPKSDEYCSVYSYKTSSGEIRVHLEYVGEKYSSCSADSNGLEEFTFYVKANVEGAKVYKVQNKGINLYTYIGKTVKDDYAAFQLDTGRCIERSISLLSQVGLSKWDDCRMSVEIDGKKCAFDYTIDLNSVGGSPKLKAGSIRIYEGADVCKVVESFKSDGTHTEKIGFDVQFTKKPCGEAGSCDECLENECIWCERAVGGGCMSSCDGFLDCAGGSCLKGSCPAGKDERLKTMAADNTGCNAKACGGTDYILFKPGTVDCAANEKCVGGKCTVKSECYDTPVTDQPAGAAKCAGGQAGACKSEEGRKYYCKEGFWTEDTTENREIYCTECRGLDPDCPKSVLDTAEPIEIATTINAKIQKSDGKTEDVAANISVAEDGLITKYQGKTPLSFQEPSGRSYTIEVTPRGYAMCSFDINVFQLFIGDELKGWSYTLTKNIRGCTVQVDKDNFPKTVEDYDKMDLSDKTGMLTAVFIEKKDPTDEATEKPEKADGLAVKSALDCKEVAVCTDYSSEENVLIEDPKNTCTQNTCKVPGGCVLKHEKICMECSLILGCQHYDADDTCTQNPCKVNQPEGCMITEDYSDDLRITEKVKSCVNADKGLKTQSVPDSKAAILTRIETKIEKSWNSLNLFNSVTDVPASIDVKNCDGRDASGACSGWSNYYSGQTPVEYKDEFFLRNDPIGDKKVTIKAKGYKDCSFKYTYYLTGTIAPSGGPTVPFFFLPVIQDARALNPVDLFYADPRTEWRHHVYDVTGECEVSWDGKDHAFANPPDKGVITVKLKEDDVLTIKSAGTEKSDQTGICGASSCGGIDLPLLGKIKADNCDPNEKCIDGQCIKEPDCGGVSLVLGQTQGSDDEVSNGLVYATLTIYNYNQGSSLYCDIDWGFSNEKKRVFFKPRVGDVMQIIPHFYPGGSYVVKVVCDGDEIFGTAEDRIKVDFGDNACKDVRVVGPSEDKLNIVFVGDRIEPAVFENTVNNAYKKLLSVEPFKTYSDRINIYRVDSYVELCKSGFADLDSARQIASVCPHEQIILLADCGGVSNYQDVSVVGANAASIVHEFGHSFGKLGDEYEYSEKQSDFKCDRPNIDYAGCPKWKGIIPNTFCSPGASSGCYRATASCIMIHDSFNEFCPVCRIHLEELLKKYK